jgi:hypothetical protein
VKTIELAVEGDHAPLREGEAYRLRPVVGEGGAVVAWRVVDDADTVVMTLSASAVKMVERP